MSDNTQLRHPSLQNIKVATDAVIFSIVGGKLVVLLIQMKKKPHTGKWAVPGGLLGDDEKSRDAVRTILRTQTGVADVYLEQLATFDDTARDPLGRVVSIAYMALLRSDDVKLRTTEKYNDIAWWPVKRLPPLAYDHAEMISVAVTRLRAKLSYTNIVWSLLPRVFTLSDLQRVYEIILGKTFDKRNFRKRILSLGLVVSTGKKRSGSASRPAALYRFRNTRFTQVPIVG